MDIKQDGFIPIVIAIKGGGTVYGHEVLLLSPRFTTFDHLYKLLIPLFAQDSAGQLQLGVAYISRSDSHTESLGILEDTWPGPSVSRHARACNEFGGGREVVGAERRGAVLDAGIR